MSDTYIKIKTYLDNHGTTLVAVSKTKSLEDIMHIYNQGQRIFGENRVQEMVDKHAALPKDIQWHLIGQLQRNKVKYIAPWIHMIQSVDSLRLCKAIHDAAIKTNRVIDILLQVKIAEEHTKSGYNIDLLNSEINALKSLNGCCIRGFMGIGTFTDDQTKTDKEFEMLSNLFTQYKQDHFIESEKFDTLSMGMSGDYKRAIAQGSNMVRIGSLIFGSRS